MNIFKNAKKILALIMVIVIASSLFTSCGSKDKGAKKDTTGIPTSDDKSYLKDEGKDSQTSTQQADKEPVILSICVSSSLGTESEDLVIVKELEKVFKDITIDFWILDSQTYEDQLATRVAGGDIPDIMDVKNNIKLQTFVKQNIVAEVPIDFLRENAPDYFKAIQEYGSDVLLACNSNGKNYGMPRMNPFVVTGNTDGWRKDWLDNVGITKVPETLEEMEEAFKRFTYNDPDKNGANDTYAVCPYAKVNAENIFGSVFGAHGVFSNMWMVQPDDTLKLGITMPESKEALALLNMWYKAGYIDPGFITASDNVTRNKWYNGKIGYFDVGQWKRLMPNGIFQTNLKAINPDAKVILAPPIKGLRGDYGYYCWARISSMVCFGKHLERTTKLARAIQFLNAIATTEELANLVSFGIEGEHWVRDETGTMVFTEAYSTTDKRMKLGTNMAFAVTIPELMYKQLTPDITQYTKYSKMTTIKPEVDYVHWPRVFCDADLLTKYYDEMRPTVSKWMINFITGNEPISRFDDFLKEWKNIGGEDIEHEMTRAYKEGKPIIEKYAAYK